MWHNGTVAQRHKGGNSPVNQLENKSSHHERLLRLTRTAGNAANWPVASRRSFWFRDPRAPRVSSAAPVGISELFIPVHAEDQTELILLSTSPTLTVLTVFWVRLSVDLLRITCMHIVVRCHKTLPFFELHREGQTDIFPGAGREGAATVPLGPGSFLINSSRCSAPRLLCIRCIPGSPYEVHLPHTRIRLRRGRRSYHWSPADTGGAQILLRGCMALTTAYPSSHRQIYIKSSPIPAGEGPGFPSSSPRDAGRGVSRNQIKRAGRGGRRRGLGLSVMCGRYNQVNSIQSQCDKLIFQPGHLRTLQKRG